MSKNAVLVIIALSFGWMSHFSGSLAAPSVLPSQKAPLPVPNKKAPPRPIKSAPIMPPVTQNIWKYSADKNEQFKKDKIIFFNTLFPNPENTQKLMKLMGPLPTSEKERQNFLKRVFLTLADAPLTYTHISNDKASLKEWDHPLATALGHGMRISFDLKYGSKAQEFYNLLVSGRPDKASKIDLTRKAASHGFKLNKKGDVEEIKLKGLGSVNKI